MYAISVSDESTLPGKHPDRVEVRFQYTEGQATVVPLTRAEVDDLVQAILLYYRQRIEALAQAFWE